MLKKNTDAKGKRIPYTSLEPARALLVIAYLVVALWYLHYRLATFNHETVWSTVFSYTLYGAELFGFMSVLLHLFMVWRLSERRAPEAKPGHSVDVFITTINEPAAIVRRTALTALNMDYPHRVYILDDGNRPEIRVMAEDLGCTYLARGSNENAKAGNLNYGLRHSNGEFICIFDSDHAPKQTFITRTLGYFEDKDVAFVQTPQDFYNLDSYQHRGRAKEGAVWSEQALFFRVIQRGKDFWNAAFFCGSCAIVRRSALDKIDGFATGTVTEDLHTSVRLHKAGFKSVYHAEPLAFGIAASQIEPFINQRVRWGQGAMQVWAKEGFLFARGLTFAQRINYCASVLTYFDGWQKLILYVSPVIVLLTGTLPILNLNWQFLIHFVPFFLMTFWVFEEVGRGFGKAKDIEQYNMIRYAAFAWSTLGFFTGARFKVTNKGFGGMRSFNRYLLPQYAIFFLNTVAIPLGILFYFQEGLVPLPVLIANVLWSGINLLLASSVLVFTIVRAGFLRQNYRFAIPLVMRFTVKGKMELPTYGAVDDISSGGFLVMSDIGGVQMRTGDIVEGDIYLPSGPLAFVARATPQQIVLKDSDVRLLGCEFIWQSSKSRDQLEVFLYGSDLEWRVQQLDEQIRTPLEFLFGDYEGPARQFTQPDAQWSSALCKDEKNGRMQSGVITHDPETQRRSLVTFSPMTVGAKLEASVFTRSGWKTLKGTLVKEERDLEVAESPNFFVYRFDHKSGNDTSWDGDNDALYVGRKYDA